MRRLLVGIMIFIPPLLAVKPPHSSFVGLLLGLFFDNALHSLTHLLIGVWDWRPTATSLPREPTPRLFRALWSIARDTTNEKATRPLGC
jgi:hypothetical protein